MVVDGTSEEVVPGLLAWAVQCRRTKQSGSDSSHSGAGGSSQL